jgi:WD40 repeat protein/Tfp pilus assembly protein PilF
MKSRYYSRIGVLLTSVLLTVGLLGCAVTPKENRYVNASPHELMVRSHITPSKGEKIQIRHYLMSRYPETVEGLYAKAYMAYVNGHEEIEAGYIKELEMKFPDAPDSLHYRAFTGTLDEQLAATRRGLQLSPEFLNYNFITHLTELYTDNPGVLDVNELLSWLDKTEAKLGKPLYVFDYARGVVSELTAKDEVQALAYYKSALEKEGGVKSRGLWKSYLTIKYKSPIEWNEELADGFARDVAEAYQLIEASDATEIEKNSLNHQLLSTFGDWSYERGEAVYAYRILRMAGNAYPTGENVIVVRNILAELKQDDALMDYLEGVIKTLPNNPDALGMLALELSYTKQYEKAERYYLRALENSRYFIDLKHYTEHYSTAVLYPTFRAHEAVERLTSLSDEFPEKASMFYSALATAHLYAGDYSTAQRYVDKGNAAVGESGAKWDNSFDRIVVDYVAREKVIHERSDNAVALSKPVVIPTTSAMVSWIVTSPDGRSFYANDGSGDYWKWDSENLAVTDIYKDAIINAEYAKSMTAPVLSPDGRYLAYVSEFEDDAGSVLLVYDIKLKRFVRQLPMIKKSSGLAWSPDGREIVAWNYGRLIKYDVEKGVVTAQGEVAAQHGADRMLWTPNGKYLALLERSSSGSIRIFDARSLKQLHILKEADWPHALGMSADGRYIFSADNRRTLSRWDSEHDFAHVSMPIPVLGRNISAHPQKSQIVVNDWGGGQHNQLIVIDYEQMKVVAQQESGAGEVRHHYLGGGEQVLAANIKTHALEMYDSQTLSLVTKYTGESAVLTGGLYANSGKEQLVSWDQDGLHVWSVTSGKKLHYWPGTFQSVLSDPENDNLLYTLSRDDEAGYAKIEKLDLNDHSTALLDEENSVIDAWSVVGDQLIMSGRPFTSENEGSLFGFVLLCQIKQAECHGRAIDMVTNYDFKTDQLSESRIKHLAVSPDGKTIALSTAWVDGWRVKETDSDVTRVYDTTKHFTEIHRIKHVGELAFSDDNHLLIKGGDEEKATRYSLETGKQAGIYKDEFRSMNISAHDSWPRTAQFAKNNLRVKVTSDNRIQLFDATSDKMALTILAKKNNEWLAYLPSGEYDSSANGADKVTWRVGDEVLSAEQHEKTYRRPGLLQSYLDELRGKGM